MGEVELHVQVPHHTGVGDIQVIKVCNELAVMVDGQSMLEGQLWGAVRASSMAWSLEDNDMLLITMRKTRHGQQWAGCWK